MRPARPTRDPRHHVRRQGTPSAALALGLALALSACSGAVDASPAAGATAAGCSAVAAAWPQQAGGQDRRDTTADSPTVAAWGKPAIVARCGVTPPGPTSDECIDADGVDWVARRLEDGMSFTTFGRTPAIEVLVPSSYSPEPLVLSAFAPAARTAPQGAHRCS